MSSLLGIVFVLALYSALEDHIDALFDRLRGRQ